MVVGSTKMGTAKHVALYFSVRSSIPRSTTQRLTPNSLMSPPEKKQKKTLFGCYTPRPFDHLKWEIAHLVYIKMIVD